MSFVIRYCIGLAALSLACASAAQAQIDDARSFFREEAARSGFGAFRPQAPAPVNAAETPQLRLTVRPLHGAAGQPVPSAALQSTGSKLFCVRTCDGYFFPVSGGVTDKAVAGFMCQASCPGAAVKLYSRSPGADIETAVGSDRSLYTKLKAALNFRTEVSPSCSCRRPNGNIATGPVYDDPTLRPGDVIVVGGRAVVFKGAASRPYSERDFTPLEKSSLPAEARQKIASVFFRPSRTVLAASKARTTASARSRVSPDTLAVAMPARGPRVILPAPFDRDPLPSAVTAFAPAR